MTAIPLCSMSSAIGAYISLSEAIVATEIFDAYIFMYINVAMQTTITNEELLCQDLHIIRKETKIVME